MKGDDNKVEKRLKVLQLARMLGNVAKACKLCGVDRTSFYKWQSRYEEAGLNGLKDQSRIAQYQPRRVSNKTTELILRYAQIFPSSPYWEIAEKMLQKHGVSISISTISKVLREKGLNKPLERVRRLCLIKKDAPLKPTEIEQIEYLDPAFCERELIPAFPARLLVQDTCKITLSGVFSSSVYLGIVLDTSCSYAFAKVYPEKLGFYAIALLQDAITFYKQTPRKIWITSVLTSCGIEFFNSKRDYSVFLERAGIKHLAYEKSRLRNGFIKRFLQDFRSEPAKRRMRAHNDKFQGWGLSELTILNRIVEDFLVHYNKSRQLGFPNLGESPSDIMQSNGKKIREKKHHD